MITTTTIEITVVAVQILEVHHLVVMAIMTTVAHGISMAGKTIMRITIVGAADGGETTMNMVVAEEADGVVGVEIMGKVDIVHGGEAGDGDEVVVGTIAILRGKTEGKEMIILIRGGVEAVVGEVAAGLEAAEVTLVLILRRMRMSLTSDQAVQEVRTLPVATSMQPGEMGMATLLPSVRRALAVLLLRTLFLIKELWTTLGER